MEQVKYNKAFKGNAIIYGKAKSGKTKLAIAVVRDIIKRGRNVVWVNADMDKDVLTERIYKGFTTEDNVGRAFILNVSPNWVSDNNIKHFIDYVFNEKGIDYEQIEMFVFDGLLFAGPDFVKGQMYTEIREKCRDKYAMLTTMQEALITGVRPILYATNCAYVVDRDGSENDDIEYDGLKFKQIKDSYFEDDLFVRAEHLQAMKSQIQKDFERFVMCSDQDCHDCPFNEECDNCHGSAGQSLCEIITGKPMRELVKK